MTDNYQYQPPIGAYGGTPPPPPPGPPPPPEWVAAPPPWSGTWPQPWGPPAAPDPVPPRRGRAPTAIGIVVALLLGFVIGAVGGWRWHSARPSVDAALPADQATPPTPPISVIPTPTAPSTSPPASGGGGATGQAPSTTPAKVPGVVDVNTKLGYQNGSGAGTGMVQTPSGEILTNNHVVDGATSISVTVVDTGRTYRADVVGTDPTEDVAVIQLQGASGLKTIPVGDSATVARGDPVVAVGNAGGVGGTPAVAPGTVEALNQTITASDPGGANPETLNGLIQTDAPLQPGDSGGPLVDRHTQVIGMDTAASAGRRFSSGATQGFAIPINHAVSIAQQIESGHPTATIHIGVPGFIGVVISRTTSTATGAVIAGIEPGSPAAGAGLAVGDTITSIDGQTVDSPQSLTTLTRTHHPGDKVTIDWTDQSGARHSAGLTLAVGPAD